MFKLTGISVILLLTTLIDLFATAISWQRRKSRDGWYFTLGMLGVTFWTLTAGLEYMAIPLSLKIFLARLEAMGYNLALVLFAMFSLSYAGHEDWLKRTWVRILLVILPLSNILLACSNAWHDLVLPGFQSDELVNNLSVLEHGPAFVWSTISGYLLVAVIIGSLLQVSFTGTLRSRRQALLVLLGLILMVASDLLYLFDIPHLPGAAWSSIALSLTGLLFLVALYGERFLDIAPIARNSLIEQMADGVLVLDMRGNLVDYNPASQTMLALAKKDLWTPIQTVLERWPGLLTWLSDSPSRAGFEFSLGQTGKVCEANLTPLEDQRGQTYGQLVVIRDVSERKRMEESLRQSEEKFYKAFHSSPDGIVITRLEDGYIVDVNEGFCRITGFNRDEAVAETTLHLGLWVNPQEREAMIRSLQESGRIHDQEHTFRRKSGEKMDCLLSVEINLLNHIEHLIYTLRDVTQQKMAEAQLLAAQAQLNEQQSNLARMEERRRMGRTLHDAFSQSIHSLLLFTQTLEAVIEKGNLPRARQIAAQVRESARQAHKETRLMLFELQSSGSGREMNLRRDMEERLEKVERHAGMHAELRIEGSLEDLPGDWQENLYWIASEALNNAIKHSQARSVQVTIRCTPGRLELQVSDNGKGFDPQKARGGGMGLENMRTRAGLLGGRLEIRPAAEGGTLVQFSTERDNARDGEEAKHTEKNAQEIVIKGG